MASVHPSPAAHGPRIRVMLVEDDPTVLEVVSRYLEREGFQVEGISNGATALNRALSNTPDLVVLDLMLPGLDGLELYRRLRAVAPVPVIMLTARGGEDDRVAGLDLGADDYVAKPFSPRELTARVKSVLRRTTGSLVTSLPDAPGRLVAGEVVVDINARQVWVRGELVELTVREFDLLAFLMVNPGRAFRREELLEKVWGYTFGDTSTVTVHVRRLREKIEADPANPLRVKTVWGVGYRFEP